MNDDDEFDDATVVHRRADDEADATVVRGRADDEAADATVVRGRADDEAEDATVVRRSAEDEQTVLRSSGESEAEIEDTAPRPRTRRERRAAASAGSVALPVDEPEEPKRQRPRRLQGFDPDRRIKPVPGSAPWDPQPSPMRGVRPGTPVVYGARAETQHAIVRGRDLVHERLGAAPPSLPVPVRAGRDALPSLERRERRSRVLTVAIGAGVLVVVAVGLTVIARIAFG